MKSKKNRTKVLVFIPTFNAVEDVKKLVSDIHKQSGDFEVSVLIIDSSTRIRPQKKLSKIDNIDFVVIPSKEFSHGGTRAKAIDFAIKKGFDYIVFTVQDVQMYNDKWLENIIEPFSIDTRVACVFGKQVPYEHHNPLSKSMMELAFKDMSPKGKLMIHKKGKKGDPGVYFNSHVNSAYKLKFFKDGIIKMPMMNYAEDQYMAKEIINNDLLKVYNPEACVYHSHAWSSAYEYFQRFFDEYRGLKESIGYYEKLGRKAVIKNAFRSGLKDSKLIMKYKSNIFRKLKWSLLAFPIELYKYLAIYFARRYKKIPQDIQNLFSREDMQKNLNTNKLRSSLRLKANLYLINSLLSNKL